MSFNLRPVFIAAAFLIAGCAASVAEEGFDSPQALLEELYGHYAGKPAGSGVDLGDQKMIEKYFTPELAAKIVADDAKAAAANEIPALDGDPFVDSQDWEITELATAVGKSSTPDTTTAKVHLKSYGEEKNLTLMLQKTAKGWQIADIDWGYDKLSHLYAE
ncbi:DUF3828 domain-containing protein [Dongia rigui]|uniref:DUF3828 domain-containing protein n=1 Tax=Dongia rigui TaxID=940149 RepID=A0ABU5DWG4_9PROT|nr:DUF3828 domain-containing protein [Dongia rigui]MDY0871645.1 DUF3828 domain-containing protein [Dongia rigui]